jgi:DNA-directed RNA polymerase specialized sigma24 family protein
MDSSIPEQVREIIRLRESGLTLDQIGKRFGITRQACHKALKRYAPHMVGKRAVPLE